ncbi:metallophosphoesterase [Jeotgalibacillus sp. S-D1]|uniref:metallophosphoesterase n=1 Tax=Jeotgalibacillus sp. S-D1 TaxID=2552189 RepID=UPI001059348B|nr:metallophosphoesterase [Jeotgalibacillus sp. S-D1]TDL34384.1 metallophosphoesterase [Jeotgalibacillus sp. S-D1]
MKIVVVSDNHGDTKRLIDIKNRYEGQVDALLHCGDSELSYDSQEMDGFVKVRGNCDFDSSYPEEKTIEVNGTKIFITHGHLFGIKQSLDRIHYKAVEENADLIFFGHSHSLGAEVIDHRLFVNPGSIMLPRDRKEASYAVIEKDKENVEVRFYTEKHKEITSWNGKL